MSLMIGKEILFCRKKIKSARRSVSRVLYVLQRDDHSSRRTFACPLKQPTRTTGREDPPAFLLFGFQRAVPIRSCSRRGLPCPHCYQYGGALLPHLFTLTPDQVRSGIFSVALSLRPPVSERPGRALPGALSPWSPDFPPASALRATRAACPPQ